MVPVRPIYIYARIKTYTSSECPNFELSNAPGLPARVGFPAVRLETITVADNCDFRFNAGKLLGKHAAAGEREMSELAIRTFIRAESDIETIRWSAVNDFEHKRFHHNFFSNTGFAAAWKVGHAFRISLKPTVRGYARLFRRVCLVQDLW